MTPEEIEELKASNEAILSKNKELLGELKKERAKNREVDLDTYNKVIEENEVIKANLEKVQKEYKTQVEKLSNDLNGKDAYLQKVIVDDGITKALLDAGVKKEMLAPAIAMLKGEVKTINDNGDYKAVVGDKALNDYAGEWVKNQPWLNIGTPDTGTNTGGQGSTTTNTQTKSKAEMTSSDKAKFIQDNGADAYLKLQ